MMVVRLLLSLWMAWFAGSSARTTTECVSLCSGDCEAYSGDMCLAMEALGCVCGACGGCRRLMSEVFDFVVVGGGTAGCAAAAALADAGFATVVLERGIRDDEAPVMRTKNAGFAKVLNDESVYEPFRFVDGVWGGVAKVLGGGSSLNSGVWIEDPDEFFEEAMLSHHLEGIRDQYEYLSDLLARPSILSEYFTEATKTAYAEALGLNGETDVLANHSRASLKGKIFDNYNIIQPEGRRGAAELCKDAEERGNLVVSSETTVDFVLIDDGTNEAVGVRMNNGSDIFAARAVVLAAGAIYSPALLTRSGIGRPSELDKVENFYNTSTARIENDFVGLNFVDRVSAPAYLPLRIPGGMPSYLGSTSAVSKDGDLLFESIGGQHQRLIPRSDRGRRRER